MELELRLGGLTEEVREAVADVQLVDLGTADAPGGPTVTTAASFTVSPTSPSARIWVDLPAPGGYEPGVVVRVRGRTARGERVEFLNTGTTPLPGRPVGAAVPVVLSRIT